LLALATILALDGASLLLWRGMHDWSGTQAIFALVDRLMLILMLVEILHTVSTSVHSGRLRPVSLYGCSGPTLVSASSDGSNAMAGHGCSRKRSPPA
jgi:hypothetical protein